MKATTTRNIPPEVARAIRRKAETERTSLNKAVVSLLEERLGARARSLEMTHVMLDTSAYSAFARGHEQIKGALQEADEIWVSSIVLGELHASFRRGTRRTENERNLSRFHSSPRVAVADVVDETAVRYAEILAFLRNAGTPVPTNDIWIAAGAMQHGLRLVTTDAHYRKIPQVVLDSYQLPA